MGVPDPDDALDPAGEVDEEVVQALLASQFHRSRWFRRGGKPSRSGSTKVATLGVSASSSAT